MNTFGNKDIENIINSILNCKDAENITEIYVSEASVVNNHFRNTICMMVCYDMDFQDKELSSLIADIDFEEYPFELFLSAEPDTAERGTGIILWKRG